MSPENPTVYVVDDDVSVREALKNLLQSVGLKVETSALDSSIIEAHGGRIWAVPNDGAGLTVQFSIPAENENRS